MVKGKWRHLMDLQSPFRTRFDYIGMQRLLECTRNIWKILGRSIWSSRTLLRMRYSRNALPREGMLWLVWITSSRKDQMWDESLRKYVRDIFRLSRMWKTYWVLCKLPPFLIVIWPNCGSIMLHNRDSTWRQTSACISKKNQRFDIYYPPTFTLNYAGHRTLLLSLSVRST